MFYFLPAFISLYLFLPTARQWTIILGSILFYAWGEPAYVVLLILFIIMNWGIGLAVGKAEEHAARKLLALGVILNLGLLGGFKYAGFLMGQIDAAVKALGWGTVPVPTIPLPLGISFFAFQGISYLIDIHRHEIKAQPSLIKFAMYKTMFPQLIAGPILRYRQIAHEINDRRVDPARFSHGVQLFILGMAQKVLIANTVALPADEIFALPPEQLTASVAWIGAICYSVQIFFDFSGYTTMAIGLGHMIGFSLPPNFNRPYTARSITDFWRRWHMSLSSWFRDYLYIPLGGNRAGPWRTYANLLIVFALCGLWHGAAWTFIIWGLYHGLFLILERAAARRQTAQVWLAAVPVPFRHAYALLIVLIGWVIFRSDTLVHAWQILCAMAGFATPAPTALPPARFVTPSVTTALLAAVLLVAAPPAWWRMRLPSRIQAGVTGAASFAGCLILFVLTAAIVASGTHNPFIYFRF